MFIKNLDGKPLFCYDSVPEDQPIETRTVFNHCLKVARDMIDYAYNTFKSQFSKITKPNVYLCFIPDDVTVVNAFTDGKDIYMFGAVFLGMESYINERLDTLKEDPEIFLEGLEAASKRKIRENLIELIVSHELMHIWHGHVQWLNTIMPISGNEKKAEIIDETITYSDDFKSVGFPELEAGLVRIVEPNQEMLLHQVIEIDSDCGAITLLMMKLFNEVAPYIRKVTEASDEEKKNIINSTALYQQKSIGLIIAAAGLMCGYFDRSMFGGNYFASLKYLNSGDHPLPSIRFYKMKLTINTVLFRYYDEDTIVDYLLKDEFTFRTDLFSRDKDKIKDDMNCFWTPVFTKEAQEHIVKLEQGWNKIHDTLEPFALFDIAVKFSEEEMAIPDENIIFDLNGNYLRK